MTQKAIFNDVKGIQAEAVRQYKQKVRTKMNELVVECISHSTDELINEHIIKRIVQNKMRDLELE